MQAWIGLICSQVLLGSCSFVEDKDRGERAVARFHHLFAVSEYSQILAPELLEHPELRIASTELGDGVKERLFAQLQGRDRHGETPAQ